MREIKFRGKRVDNGEWVYGYLDMGYTASSGFGETGFYITEYKNDSFFNHEIETGSQSEFTGLHDKNNNHIYDQDIVSGWRKGSNSDRGYTGVVEWNHQQAGWVIKCGKFTLEILSLAMSGDGETTTLDSFEVVGNIFDSPKLIK